MSAFSDQEKAVAKVIIKGLTAGLSEARSLDQAGWLLTPEVKKSIASKALSDVAQLLEETPISDIIPQGRGYAPNDVKRSIAEWIAGIVESNEGASKGSWTR